MGSYCFTAHILDSLLARFRSPLPLGEQLHWSLQLRSLPSFLVLRGCHMHLPPFHGNAEGYGYNEQEILRESSHNQDLFVLIRFRMICLVLGFFASL